MTALLRSAYKVRSGYTVCYAENLMPNRSREPRDNRVYVKQERKEITFSADAHKRFREAIDNFACIFKSAEKFNPSLLFHTVHNKIHRRRPVFVTLTIPKQATDDKTIKRKALDNLLTNLKKYYGLKAFVWKAEAQERGAIHFHLVIDSFIFESRLRRLWFNNLKRLGCIPAGQTLQKSSRLVHFKVIRNLNTIAAELSSYFEGNRDDEGYLIHKHDPQKRVRDITGRSWGCSENLKYKAFTAHTISAEVQEEAVNTSIRTIEIETDKGRKVAEVYIYQDNLPGRNYLQKLAEMFHFDHACKLYSKELISNRLILREQEKNLFRLHETCIEQLKTEAEKEEEREAAEAVKMLLVGTQVEKPEAKDLFSLVDRQH